MTPLTDTARSLLEAELDHLRSESEPQAWQRVRDLRDGAPAEDNEIRLALEEHERIRQRIAEIERLLAQPSAVTLKSDDAITLGSRVVVRDGDGREHQFVLVSPPEAGATRGFISTASPVGSALLGRRAGDVVQVDTPAGRRIFTILSVT